MIFYSQNKQIIVELSKYLIIPILMFIISLFYCLKKQIPVYCLMITGYNRERLNYARKSIDNFNNQTYKNKYLIILNQSNISLKTKQQNILEVKVDKLTLGELRNMSLELVPPNAIWTIWDDDDYRNKEYISTMVSIMNENNVNSVFFKNRIEYNKTNNFSFIMTLKTGFMTMFCKKDPFVKYAHVFTNEDVPVKQYILNNMSTYIYDNDPKMYIRLIHNDNTSVYVQKDKNKLKDTSKNKIYFERKLNTNEYNYLNEIVKNYYKIEIK